MILLERKGINSFNFIHYQIIYKEYAGNSILYPKSKE